MADDWRFQFDYAGVGEFLRTDAELADAVRGRAELAQAFAQSIAPIGTPEEGDHHPGHYRDSFAVTGPKAMRDRQGFYLENSADYADAVEAHHRVLGRTVAAFGDPKGGEGLD